MDSKPFKPVEIPWLKPDENLIKAQELIRDLSLSLNKLTQHLFECHLYSQSLASIPANKIFELNSINDIWKIFEPLENHILTGNIGLKRIFRTPDGQEHSVDLIVNNTIFHRKDRL